MAISYLSLMALATMAAGATLGEWSIFCGDSCSDGTLVASGSVASNTCVSLGGSYDYCYVQTEDEIYTDFWLAYFLQNADCLVDNDEDGYRESNRIVNGSCTPAGPWVRYQVVANA